MKDFESVARSFLNLENSALDLLFPIHCAGCGREGGVICDPCIGDMQRLSPPYCRVCADPGVNGLCQMCQHYPRGFDSLRSPFLFEGAVRNAIHRLKYKGERASARPLAGLMSEYLERNPATVDLLIPTPLHERRLRSRGYNQSAILARELGKREDLPVREELLVRVRDPRPQVETQTRAERRDNVAGNFECRSDTTGLSGLLIDDVATTGSTLSECAFALKAAGAVRVHALTLAREG